MSNPAVPVPPPGDHCSFVPDKPWGFDFSRACLNHDVNFSPESRLSFAAANRAFRDELHDICRLQYGDSLLCHITAEVYFIGVSLFGRPFYQGPGGN